MKIENTSPEGYQSLRRGLPFFEWVLAAGAAGLTVVVWLGIAGVGTGRGAPPPPATYVTLPTVVVVGHREPELTPVASAGQNTGANAVNLR